nr:MAG TPA: hypothetical protein [Caudoviricetes sp.]
MYLFIIAYHSFLCLFKTLLIYHFHLPLSTVF